MSDAEDTIDWEALRYFLHAARSRSLSGAARSLNVEHTTVGRRISSLERAVGASLVNRGPAGLDLTPLGARVLELASEMDRLAGSVRDLATTKRTSVRLVVPTGFTSLLTPQLAALRRIEPKVALEIDSGARRVDLRKGEADLAIRVGPIDDEVLIARKLGEVGSALYAARSYVAAQKTPIDPADLRGHAVIGFDRSLAEMPAAKWLAERTAQANIVMRSRDAVDMLSAARTGAGLAVLPCFLADADATLVRITREPVATRHVSLVYRREAKLAPEVRSVIGFITTVMKEHARTLKGSR